MSVDGILVRKNGGSVKRGATRRGRAVLGASRTQTPFDWSRVWRPVKRLTLFTGVMVICVFAYQRLDAYQLEHLAIKTVHINGTRQYTSENEVTKIIGAYTQNDFFNLKIEAMRDSLVAVPWVKSVSLRKEWPDRLVVNIEEHQPVAHWKDENQRNWLLSATGVQFESEFSVPDTLPVFSGQNVNIEKIMNQYKTVSMALLPRDLSVKEVALNTRHEWLLVLSNGIQIKYLDDDASMAIQRMLLALNVLSAEQLKHVETIDLRYEHGFAVRWGEDKHV